MRAPLVLERVRLASEAAPLSSRRLRGNLIFGSRGAAAPGSVSRALNPSAAGIRLASQADRKRYLQDCGDRGGNFLIFDEQAETQPGEIGVALSRIA